MSEIDPHLDRLPISFYNDWIMSEVKQILVVDDHFEMLEFLRSMLELANQEYQVLGVPSAEEAYLELRRMPYDLLITDLRLPGMSGFELVRQARRWWPTMPVVMITAYSSIEGRREAEDLGIHGYFEKPPHTDALLASVRSALERAEGGREAQPQPGPAEPSLPATLPAPIPPEAISSDIDRCLHNLQADTGAVQVVLSSLIGDVLFVTGAQSDVDILKLARIVAAGLDNSFALAGELQSAEPFAIQYQAGRRYDLYAANVGRSHFVMLVVDAQVRRGRIGTVWVFTQRAIKQLGSLLKELHEVPAATPPPQKQPAPGGKQTRPERPPEARPIATAPLVDKTSPPAEPVKAVPADPLIDLFTEEGIARNDDLDAYWEKALTNDNIDQSGEGISFEEALQQGLIPPQFGKSDDE